MTELYLPFIFAYFGGISINMLILAELRNIKRSERPETFSDPIYTFWFFGIPVLGGILAIAYQMSNFNLTPLLAINVGASAPLVLKALVAAIPQSIENRNID